MTVHPPALRPTFRLHLALPRDEAIRGIRAALAARDDLAGRWRGKGRWAELYVPHAERRIWSPYLSVRLDAEEDGSSLLARYAPHPEVWTFFVFLYILTAFLTLFGATLAYVQWTSGEPAWGMWAVWVGTPLLALMHAASWLGQRWGREQMLRLRRELDEVLVAVDGLAPRSLE